MAVTRPRAETRHLRESYWEADTSVPLRDQPLGELLSALAREIPDHLSLVATGVDRRSL